MSLISGLYLCNSVILTKHFTLTFIFTLKATWEKTDDTKESDDDDDDE